MGYDDGGHRHRGSPRRSTCAVAAAAVVGIASDSDVAIWSIRTAAGASWTLPSASAGTRRTLYFFEGSSLRVADEMVRSHAGIEVAGDVEVRLEAGDAETEILLLQGRPIAETVVQYGPFVMNSRAEVERAMADYRRTRFGGWPWPSDAPVHARDAGVFAKHADGRVEKP